MITKDEIDKALSIFDAQDRQELDFCYEGGEKDAVLVAKTMVEAYRTLLIFYEASQ